MSMGMGITWKNVNKTKTWEWEWKGVRMNVDGNGNDPLFPLEKKHSTVCAPLLYSAITHSILKDDCRSIFV